jgi:hypothetical protein
MLPRACLCDGYHFARAIRSDVRPRPEGRLWQCFDGGLRVALSEQLQQTGAFRDPARPRLIELRKSVVGHWMKIAETLDAQGEIALATDVRYSRSICRQC